MAQRTKKKKASKPEKPYPDFPLFPHATGRWAKKIRGKFVYFGKWADPDAAVKLYQEQRDDLYAGRKPRAATGGLTVKGLANCFLNAKRHLVDTREITARTFADYRATCTEVVEAFGKTRRVDDLAADDFELLRKRLAKGRAKGNGPVSLGNQIQRVRVLFKYAYDAGLMDRPVRYGPTFKRPSKAVLRKDRNKKGPRMFEPAELRAMLDGTTIEKEQVDGALPQLRAMILLGINAGFGNADVGTLPAKAVDLVGGWVDYPRPKTGIERRVPLWPETIEALRVAIASHPAPKDEAHAGLVFITKYGGSWSKEEESRETLMGGAGDPEPTKRAVDNPVSKETLKLLKRLKLHRPGLGFYALRHTFETVGGESGDQVAVDAIMGHAPRGDDMSAVYRERVKDERLRKVTDHVRAWLFGEAATTSPKSA